MTVPRPDGLQLNPVRTTAGGWSLCVVLFTEQQEDREQSQHVTPGTSEDTFVFVINKNTQKRQPNLSAYPEVTGGGVIA